MRAQASQQNEAFEPNTGNSSTEDIVGSMLFSHRAPTLFGNAALQRLDSIESFQLVKLSLAKGLFRSPQQDIKGLRFSPH